MKIIAEMLEASETRHLPLIRLYVHNAPHRRMHAKVIQAYRKDLRQTFLDAKIAIPIRRDVDLSVLFIDPSSPDLDNLLMALYQALDKVVLADDGLIQSVHIAKYFPYDRKGYLSSVS